MRIADLFSLSTRMFRTRPTRTWLTILGISVGIGAVLFLVSLGYGLQNIILQKIVFNQAMLSLAVSPSTDLIIIDKQTLSDFSAISNVTDVAPLANFMGQAALDEINGTVEIRAVDSPFFGYAGVVAQEGNIYEKDEKGSILVSEAVLKLFGIKDTKTIIGKELAIKVFLTKKIEEQSTLEIIDLPNKYIVKGIVEDGQSSYLYIPLQEISEFVKVDNFELAQVKVDDANNLQAVKDVVLAKGFQTQSLSETIEQANKIFSVIQIVLGLFGAVALAVSSIGMFNTMTVTLLERTNEIGIMRALGSSKRDMKNLFLSESVIIGFLGGLTGVVIGFLGGQLFNWGINSLASKFGGAKTNLFMYPGWFLAIIVGLSIVIGFFSGIFPARKAAGMDPLEALRYK